MIGEAKVDPRVKLIIVLCISSLGIIINNVMALFQILMVTLVIAFSFGANLMHSIRRFKKFLYVIIGIAIMQSLFSIDGKELIALGPLTILSTHGLEKGLEFILRMMIIFFSASLLATSNARQIIQAFVQLGMPYELAFMVATGIRFLPLLTEEVKDSLVAIQLRGIELDQITLKERLSIYSYIFVPVIRASLSKAERLALSIEMRGFRAYNKRTSYRTLKMSPLDYLILLLTLIGTLGFSFYYFSL